MAKPSLACPLPSRSPLLPVVTPEAPRLPRRGVFCCAVSRASAAGQWSRTLALAVACSRCAHPARPPFPAWAERVVRRPSVGPPPHHALDPRRRESSARHPGLGRLALARLVDLHRAGSHPGEHVHRPRHPLAVGDEGEALPGGVVADPGAEAGLHVLRVGRGLQALEIGQQEEEPQLAGLDALLQGWLQDLDVLLLAEPAAGTETDRARRHRPDSLDHQLSTSHFFSSRWAVPLLPSSNTAKPDRWKAKSSNGLLSRSARKSSFARATVTCAM